MRPTFILAALERRERAASSPAGNARAPQHLGPFLNELCHDADGDFRHGFGLNFDADRTGHFRQLFRSRDLVIDELLKDEPLLTSAADHAQKCKWLMNPP